MSPVRVVVARGDPLERGRTVGYELADLIRSSLEFYWRYLVRRGVRAAEHSGSSPPTWPPLSGSCPTWSSWSGWPRGPGCRSGSCSTSTPSGSWSRLEARSGLPQITGDRCSTVTISGPGYTLLGHNEQWLAGDAGHVAVVVELPDDGPALVSPPWPAAAAVGMNEYRVAQGIQSLVANDDGVGIPRVLVSRHALVASSPPTPCAGPPCPAGPAATGTASPSAPAAP